MVLAPSFTFNLLRNTTTPWRIWIPTSAGESIGLLFDDPAFALRYRLDKTTRALYCGIDRFSSIDECLRLLTEDSDVDRLLALMAHLFDDPGYFVPTGEEGHDLAMRQLDHAATDSNFVAALVRDYLRPDAKGHFLADPLHQSSTSLTER